MKQKPAIIHPAYRTSDEVARRLGISKKRQKELDAIVEKSLGKKWKAKKSTLTGRPGKPWVDARLERGPARRKVSIQAWR